MSLLQCNSQGRRNSGFTPIALPLRELRALQLWTQRDFAHSAVLLSWKPLAKCAVFRLRPIVLFTIGFSLLFVICPAWPLRTFEHATLCSKKQKDWKLACEFESKQFYSSKGEVLGFVSSGEMRRSCNMGNRFLLSLHPRQVPWGWGGWQRHRSRDLTCFTWGFGLWVSGRCP